MTATSRIVAGGGWNGSRIERVRVKAWAALFGAISLASVAMQIGDSFQIFACILAALTFLTAVVLFVRERPRELQFPCSHADYDLRKLYGAAGNTGATENAGVAEPGAPPTTPRGNPGVAEEPPSVN